MAEDEKGDERDEIGDYDDSVTLTDPEVLDCPICYDPLTSPVFQVCFFLHGFVFSGIHEIDEILNFSFFLNLVFHFYQDMLRFFESSFECPVCGLGRFCYRVRE